MFRRRRLRRQFDETVAREVERVGPAVEATATEADRMMEEAKAAVAAIPGAAARCPACGSRMKLGPYKDGRKWWTLWSCSCGKTYRPTELPVAARFGGRH